MISIINLLEHEQLQFHIEMQNLTIVITKTNVRQLMHSAQQVRLMAPFSPTKYGYFQVSLHFILYWHQLKVLLSK